MAERSSFGFTPINLNGPMPQFINPLKTLRYPNEGEPHSRHTSDDIASDAEAGEDKVLHAKSKKKRGKPVMLDLFQEGVNEIDGPAKKKRRPMAQQRSISANTPTRLSQIIIEDGAVPHEESEVLLTSPVPEKAKPKSRAKSKAKTSNSPSSMEHKQAPFKAPKISKPLSVEKLELIPVVTKSQPVSNHPSLTTTENAVKNSTQGGILSKTTMSKLHSFLYVPPVSHVASAFPSSAQAESHMSGLELGYEVDVGSPLITSKYGSGTICDALAETRNENFVSVRSDQTFDLHAKLLPHVSSPMAMHASDEMFGGKASLDHQSHKDRVFQHTKTHREDGGIDGTERYDVDGNVAQTRVNHAQTRPTALVQIKSTHEQSLHDLPVSMSDSDEPSSSEVKAFTHLMKQAELRPKENQALSGAPIEVKEMASEVLNSYDERNSQHALSFTGPAREEANHELLPPFTQNTHIELGNHPHPQNHLRGLQYLFDDEETQSADDEDMLIEDLPLSDVYSIEDDSDADAWLVEESMHPSAVSKPALFDGEEMLLNEYLLSEIETGNEGHELLPSDDQIPTDIEFGHDFDAENMLQDHRVFPKDQVGFGKPSEVDEFDNGLDDSDLLEMLSTNPTVEMKESKFDDELPPKPNAKRTLQHASRTTKISRTALPTPGSPQIVDLDADDEFPMDESDEEEMLKFPVVIEGIPRLGLSPPRFPGDRPSSSAVHDSNPQLLSHRSLSSTAIQTQSSPSRSAHAPVAAPQIRSSEPRSDPLGEGENWTHRSIDRVQIVNLRDIQLIDLSDEADSYVEQLMPPPPPRRCSNLRLSVSQDLATRASVSEWKVLSEYEPLQSFARPAFPDLVRDRCPVIGLSDQNFLRTCFKIGEMFKEGKRCSSFGQDAIIELFARVTFSSREAGTTKQYFVFADLWRDNPPFPEGMLMNYKTTGLADTESKAFVGAGEPKMARCLGRLKRDMKNATGWLLHIITIRETDWEEIRYTKKSVCAGEIKSEPKKFDIGTNHMDSTI